MNFCNFFILHSGYLKINKGRLTALALFLPCTHWDNRDLSESLNGNTSKKTLKDWSLNRAYSHAFILSHIKCNVPVVDFENKHSSPSLRRTGCIYVQKYIICLI